MGCVCLGWAYIGGQLVRAEPCAQCVCLSYVPVKEAVSWGAGAPHRARPAWLSGRVQFQHHGQRSRRPSAQLGFLKPCVPPSLSPSPHLLRDLRSSERGLWDSPLSWPFHSSSAR